LIPAAVDNRILPSRQPRGAAYTLFTR